MVLELHNTCHPEFFVTDQNILKPDEVPPELKVDDNKRLINLPPVVLIVIGVLIAVHFVLQFANQPWQSWVQFAFAFIPARFGPGPFPQLPGSAYWSMFTYAFLHADWFHVATNSVWLAIFSKPVATWMGTARYLAILVISIIAGAVAGLVVHWGQFVIMVGASAGVSGVLAAAIPIMYGGDSGQPNQPTGILSHFRPLSPMQFLTNRRALIFTFIWLGATMITATSQYMTGTAFLEERVVAWEAHLGGFIAGLISFYLLDRKRTSVF
jgi:membrane associated rhomboid family serine protease